MLSAAVPFSGVVSALETLRPLPVSLSLSLPVCAVLCVSAGVVPVFTSPTFEAMASSPTTTVSELVAVMAINPAAACAVVEVQREVVGW